MKITPPQIPKILASQQDLAAQLANDDTLSSMQISQQDIGAIAAVAPTIQESKLDKVIAQSAKLPRASFSDVQIAGCDFTATDMSEASWHRVSFKASRCSSLQLPNSTLKDVSFVGCKLNLANFRFATLTNVLFDDCILDEADFYAAKLSNVRFRKCTFVKAQFSTATLFRTDFRSSDLYGITGINGLAGATIDSVQLARLAPLFAAQLKIEVSDD